MSTPVLSLKSSPERCSVVPTPFEPMLSLPGFAFASAISSGTEFALRRGSATSMFGTLAMTAIDIPPAYDVLRRATSGAQPGREIGGSTGAVQLGGHGAGRARVGRDVLLEIPPVHAGDKVYQLYQTTHGLPILGGRLARGPRVAYERLHRDPFQARLFDRDPLRLQDGLLALDGLDSLGVTWVMLHDNFDPRTAAIQRVLERQFEVVPTPPGPERLLRRRTAPLSGPTSGSR